MWWVLSDWLPHFWQTAVLWIPAVRSESVFANNLAVMVVVVVVVMMMVGGWFSSRWAPYRVSAPLHIYIYIYNVLTAFPWAATLIGPLQPNIKAIQPFQIFCNYLPVYTVSASQQTWIFSSTAVRTPNLVLTLSVTRSVTWNTEWAKRSSSMMLTQVIKTVTVL